MKHPDPRAVSREVLRMLPSDCPKGRTGSAYRHKWSAKDGDAGRLREVACTTWGWRGQTQPWSERPHHWAAR